MELPTSGLEADTRYMFFRPFQGSISNIARLLDLTKLCKQCREADYEGFLNKRHEISSLDKDNSTISYLQGSFRDDCTVCSLFISVIERRFGSDVGKMNSGEKLEVVKCRDKSPNTLGLVHTWLDFWFEGYRAHYMIAKIDQSSILDERDPCRYTAVSDILSEDEVADQTSVNFGRIRSWLGLCESQHGDKCVQKPARWSVEKIKVIDCRTGQLCEIDSGQKYIALSYLWGESGRQMPSTGRHPHSRFPRTIEDAMTVALGIGVSYLWVDRYCIDQENDEEKSRLIRNMDQIYQNAHVTIIACAGSGPGHGLPGVNNTPRSLVESLVLGRYTLVDPYITREEIRDSRWNQHAWVFQETLLSHRRLIFTSTETCFQCQCMTCFESIASLRRLPPAYSLFGNNTQEVYKSIRDFFTRRLSYDSDRLRAIQGIMNSLQGEKIFPPNRRSLKWLGELKNHFWGIPILSKACLDDPKDLENVSFRHGLLFKINGLPQQSYMSGFPTWSWAGHNLPSSDAKSPADAFRLDFLNQENEHFGDCAIFEWSPPSVLATAISGTRIDAAGFYKLSHDYEHFLPHLEITSWSVWTTFRRLPNVECSKYQRARSFDVCHLGCEIHPSHGELVMAGEEEACFDFLDDWNGQRLLVMYIQAYSGYGMRHKRYMEPYCLLLQEKTQGIFRRVGIWYSFVYMNVNWDSMDVDEFFASHFRPTSASADAAWEKRSVRVD